MRAANRLILTAIALLLVTACSSAPARSKDPGLLSGTMGGNAVALLSTFKTRTFGTVLTSGTGYTLYWFSKDTSTTSACTSLCIPQWPPVTGTPRAVSGVRLTGKLGTITLADGTRQATYAGHPLYTFAGDFDPGDVGGNDVTQFGGTWHVIQLRNERG